MLRPLALDHLSWQLRLEGAQQQEWALFVCNGSWSFQTNDHNNNSRKVMSREHAIRSSIRTGVVAEGVTRKCFGADKNANDIYAIVTQTG